MKCGAYLIVVSLSQLLLLSQGLFLDLKTFNGLHRFHLLHFDLAHYLMEHDHMTPDGVREYATVTSAHSNICRLLRWRQAFTQSVYPIYLRPVSGTVGGEQATYLCLRTDQLRMMSLYGVKVCTML